MKHKNHKMMPKELYEKTKDFFRFMTIERQGYYDAQPGGSLKHKRRVLWLRKKTLCKMDKLLRYDPYISSVIDVGCGRGDFTIKIAKRYPQLSKIWGCDFVKEVLSIARKDAASLERVSFQEADLLNMPFEDNSFDLTICLYVLHHIHESDLARALSELARITNRYLIIEIRNSDSLYYKYVYPNRTMYPGGISVHPTNISYVSNLLRSHGFRLRKQRGMFLFNWLSPLIWLMYDRQASVNTA